MQKNECRRTWRLQLSYEGIRIGLVAYSKNKSFESIKVTLSDQTQSSGVISWQISVDEPYDSTCEVNTYHPSYGSR